MKKKFIPMLLLSLFLTINSLTFYPTNANAETTAVSVNNDDSTSSYEIGTHNLNDTAENSAKVGGQLLNPEKGWKRYDDCNTNIMYNYDSFLYNFWEKNTSNKCKYKGTAHYSSIKKVGASLIFKFTGNKIRLIAGTNKNTTNTTSDVKITIDNNESETVKFDYTPDKECRLIYENTNINSKYPSSKNEHIIAITNPNVAVMNIDAIDIDEEGELKLYTIDEYEKGEKNLNNTPENSAKVKDILKNPEIGWNRFDDSNSLINYSKNQWTYRYQLGKYKYTDHLSYKHPNSTVNFAFKGSKLRIISQRHNVESSNICITIDGIPYTITNVKSDNKLREQSIIFDSTELNEFNLEDKIHYVTILNRTSDFFDLDAIDTDGELVPYKNHLLSITSTNGITKKYAVSEEELNNFNNWYDESNNKGQVTYKFEKTLNDKTYNEYIVFDKIESYSVDDYDKSSTDLNDTDKDDNILPQSDKKLSITLVSGKTKSYDVTSDEANKFLEWFNSHNGNGQVKYVFSKDKNNTSNKEYITFDKITSFKLS